MDDVTLKLRSRFYSHQQQEAFVGESLVLLIGERLQCFPFSERYAIAFGLCFLFVIFLKLGQPSILAFVPCESSLREFTARTEISCNAEIIHGHCFTDRLVIDIFYDILVLSHQFFASTRWR